MNSIRNKRVLITGFGPFPGVPENPSAILASELCKMARAKWPKYHFIPHVFDTNWHCVQSELPQLIETHKPVLALHFGIGSQKSALHIERHARNHTSGTEDNSGSKTCCGPIHTGSPERLHTRLPLFPILTELQAHGIDAHISNNAGDYLCNYLFYNALHQSDVSQTPPITGFIHLPTCVIASPGSHRTHARNKTGTHLNWSDLIKAGLIIISQSLKKAELAHPLHPIV